MITTTAAGVTGTKQSNTSARTRALCVAGAALAAVAAWAVEVPLLGIHLTFRFGSSHLGPGPLAASHVQTISVGQIIGGSLAAALLGWLLLTLLERHTSRARLTWTSCALVVLAASLSLPLAAATTTAATVSLVVTHLTVGAAVIPAMARTAQTR
jgi:high-affinity Fe2+/Pb2+ permease